MVGGRWYVVCGMWYKDQEQRRSSNVNSKPAVGCGLSSVDLTSIGNDICWVEVGIIRVCWSDIWCVI